MKNYIIVLLPEKETGETIESFREKALGLRVVDGLPPHVTFKRRFVLADGFTESALVDYFKGLKLRRFEIDFVETKYLEDAFVMIGCAAELVAANKMTVKELGDKIITTNPEWEGDSFIIHMTLLRGKFVGLNFPKIARASFDRLTLYEIDPTPARLYANELASLVLERPSA